MKKILIATMIASGAALLSTGAMAQAYVGVGAGVSHLNADCTGTTSCDTSGNSFKLYGGYGFGSGLSAELGYIDFGKATFTASGINGSIKTRAVLLGLAYRGAFSPDWGGTVRLGLANVKTDGNASGGGASGSVSDTTNQPYFGFGVDYALSKNAKLELTADFSRSEIQGNKGDVRAIGIGVRFDF